MTKHEGQELNVIMDLGRGAQGGLGKVLRAAPRTEYSDFVRKRKGQVCGIAN